VLWWWQWCQVGCLSGQLPMEAADCGQRPSHLWPWECRMGAGKGAGKLIAHFKVGGLGWYVDVSVKIAGTSQYSCQKRAVHRVWVMGAVFCVLGWDIMLEYSRYPNGGIGSYVVEC